MCDAYPQQFNIKMNMVSNPSCPSPCRKASNTSCASAGRRAGCSTSKGSVRSNNSNSSGQRFGLPIPDCMRECPKPKCCNEPRADCCRIPCCPPPLPKCPQGVYVEKVQSLRPNSFYVPSCAKFADMSQYRADYHLKCGERVRSFKPFNTFDPSCAKMDGMSTYRATYTPKPVCPYMKPPWSKAAQFDPSCAKMEAYSTYRFDYKGCMGERAKSIVPSTHPFDPSCAKMDGITTYRHNYVPYCSREYDYAKQGSLKPTTNPGFSCAKMDGITTYRGDFWPKCCAKRRSLKPNNKARFSDAKFADRTTYRNDFNPFHFQKCVGECIPAEIYHERYPDCGIFACGLENDPPARDNYDENQTCAPSGPCCGPPPAVTCCGDAMGLYPGAPLPECCKMDSPPRSEAGDC